jgi:hypothetical protein
MSHREGSMAAIFPLANYVEPVVQLTLGRVDRLVW